MLKADMLNSEIMTTISKMGHTDSIAIADAGLPIPDNVKRIDLALTRNIPSFIETLKVVIAYLEVEEIVLAEEIKDNNPKILNEIKEILSDKKIIFCKHEEFKASTGECKAVVRTGECTPYANIILRSGVTF